jgi:putative transcriptional regulator
MSTYMLTLICHLSLNFQSQIAWVLKKEDIAKKLGSRIIQLREKKGWTQSDLARACMKDRQSIERIESGKTNPTLFTLYEIAVSLEVTVPDLVRNLA